MIRKYIKNISVDSGMIMIADREYFEERSPGFLLDKNLNKSFELTPSSDYYVDWFIAKTWNGKVHGDGKLNCSTGEIIVTDPCYILQDIEDKPNFWMEWLNETDYGNDAPEGTLILDKMGGDGEYNIKLDLTEIGGI